MILLPLQEINKLKSKERVLSKCDGCGKVYPGLYKCLALRTIRLKTKHFCSRQCISNTSRLRSRVCICLHCKQEYYSHSKLTKFCTKSCSAIYNNSHKCHGTTRSKLEQWIETSLHKLYPNLEILFNASNIIQSELDIYIPSIKLAFELNGIFHYEPIFGSTLLEKIQIRDRQKFLRCHEQGIELCVINTMQQKIFQEKTSQVFLGIITNLIDKRLAMKPTFP